MGVCCVGQGPWAIQGGNLLCGAWSPGLSRVRVLNCKCSSGVTLSVKAVQPVSWQINSSPLPLSTTVSLVGQVYIISPLMAWSPTLVIWGFCWPSLSLRIPILLLLICRNPLWLGLLSLLFLSVVCYMYGVFACMCICVPFTRACKGQKKTLDPRKLELERL